MATLMLTDCVDLDEDAVIVIEHGSYLMKVGFGGEDTPNAFRTIVGVPRMKNVFGISQKDYYIGDEAFGKRGILKLHYPIADNTIENWKNMERMYWHIWHNEIKAYSNGHPVLMTDNALYPRTYREKMAEILFEGFNVPYACIIDQSVLALLANGKKSGLVIDSGNTTSIVAVYKGEVQRNNVHKVDVNGRDLTYRMQKLMIMRGYTFTSSGYTEIVTDIVEKLGYIAADFEKETKIKDEDLVKEYELPDGQFVSIGKERFQCLEVLFKPSLMYKECDGLADALKKCINGCNEEVKEELMQNIVLCGGNTMFDGIVDRLYKELGCIPKVYKSKYLIDGFYRNLNQDALYDDIGRLTYEYCDESIKDPKRWMYSGNDRMQIHAQLERKYSVWIGGSIYSQLDDFKKCRISKQEYEEHGSSIMNKKPNFV